MRQSATVFLYELRRNIRRKGFLLTTFGVPVLVFFLMVGYNFISNLNTGGDEDESELDFGTIVKAGYVDYSGLFADPSEALQNLFIRYETEDEARAALNAETVDIYYVIAQDYLQTANVNAYLLSLDFGRVSNADGPIQQLIYSTLADGLPADQVVRLRTRAEIKEFNLERTADSARNEDADFAVVYLFIVLFFVTLIVTNGYLMQSVIEEKENRLIEILVSSISPVRLLLGKILAMSLLGLLQVAAWVIGIIILVRTAGNLPAFATSFIPNIQIQVENLPIIVIYFVLGYLFLAAVYSAVGALSNSMREGPQYAAIFMIPLFLPYYFVPLFIESPNQGLPQWLSIFPLTSPLSMVIRMTVSPVPTGELLLSIILLVLLVMGMIWLTGRLFRFQTLLSGRVPKLRDIPKLVRG